MQRVLRFFDFSGAARGGSGNGTGCFRTVSNYLSASKGDRDLLQNRPTKGLVTADWQHEECRSHLQPGFFPQSRATDLIPRAPSESEPPGKMGIHLDGEWREKARRSPITVIRSGPDLWRR